MCGKVDENVENWRFMFAGSFEYRIDRQGRAAIPPAFRKVLQERGGAEALIVSPADDALSCYPLDEWRVLEKQIRELPAFSKQARTLSRILASRAHACELDGQGRILIPTVLRRSAGLERDVIVAGAMTRFEIWSKERWESFSAQAEKLLGEVSGDLRL
jgi:MraZ protein